MTHFDATSNAGGEMDVGRSKKEAKRLLKKRERGEKKAQQIADGTWKSARKRRNQRDFHCETRETPDEMEAQASIETRAEGFRYVLPYEHKFEVYVKARWFGKTLLHLFLDEFGGFTDAYYRAAIQHGFIRLNGEISTATAVVKDGDLLQHIMHRHEPRVQAFDADMIEFESDEIVLVNKPSTIPVHPCGAYRHNSLVFLLARDFNQHPIFPVHRLDRLTSGLLVLAKSPEKAQVLSAQLLDRQVQKYYYAKVHGEFPMTVSSCSVPLSDSALVELSMEVVDGREYIAIQAPLVRIADLENRHGVRADGKPSETLVRRLAFDGEHTLVECLPRTGRQHQIRVHLAAIGFPIANDPLYGPFAFVDAIPKASQAAEDDSSAPPSRASETSSAALSSISSICPSCTKQDDGASTFNWEQAHCQGIWLHAYRYKGEAWDFTVKPPSWMATTTLESAGNAAAEAAAAMT
ncbi:unnamed protein product [Aphanomyces euteiches]